MMVEKIQSLRDALNAALEHFEKGETEEAAGIISNAQRSLYETEVVRNTALIDRLYQFVERVASNTKDKTPEEVAILPAVIQMLLTRMRHDR